MSDCSCGEIPHNYTCAERTLAAAAEETNRTVLNKLGRQELKCSYCKPHRVENAANYGSHGPKKSKQKQHRRNAKKGKP